MKILMAKWRIIFVRVFVRMFIPQTNFWIQTGGLKTIFIKSFRIERLQIQKFLKHMEQHIKLNRLVRIQPHENVNLKELNPNQLIYITQTRKRLLQSKKNCWKSFLRQQFSRSLGFRNFVDSFRCKMNLFYLCQLIKKSVLVGMFEN